MRYIKVEFVGKGDGIVAEWDGVKYTFSPGKAIQIIPYVVFQNMQNKDNAFKDYVVPYQDDLEEKKEVAKTTIEDDINQIEEEIEEKKDESKKSRRTSKPSRSRKSRTRSI